MWMRIWGVSREIYNHVNYLTCSCLMSWDWEWRWHFSSTPYCGHLPYPVPCQALSGLPATDWLPACQYGCTTAAKNKLSQRTSAGSPSLRLPTSLSSKLISNFSFPFVVSFGQFNMFNSIAHSLFLCILWIRHTYFWLHLLQIIRNVTVNGQGK